MGAVFIRRSAGHRTRWITCATVLLIGIGAQGRLCRNLRQPPPRRYLLGAATGSGRWRHGARIYPAQSPFPALSGWGKPVILIGAGTGIGPLAGFARANHSQRPMHLYFGAKHPERDLFYEEEMQKWQADGRLTSVITAFSRARAKTYVQDALRLDAERVVRLVGECAQILVCGGRDMATGVADALAYIVAPAGLTPALLKAEGRYVEDAY